MKRKYLHLIVVLLIGLASCETESTDLVGDEGAGVLPKPTAAFSYEVIDPKDPFTIKFNNTSTNFVESCWAFDDDSTSADDSPVHTFLKTGSFDVKLITLNEEDFWAQREETITISPSSLVQLQAASSGGVLEVSYETSMEISRSDWFVKQSDGSFQRASQEETLALNISAGQFAEAYVELTTPKGSKTRLNMTLTDVGIVKDLTNFENTFTVSHDNSGGKEAGEGSLKLIDNNINTKFLIFNINLIGGPFHWQFEYVQPQVINGYTMTSGNDAEGRDPLNWDLMGSDDGITWTTVDSHDGEMWTGRRQTRTFTFENTTAYQYYRLQVRDVRSGTHFQMSEFRLLQLPR